MTIHTHSPEETLAAGAEIAARLAPPAAALLIGDLGAGKTTLAKGIVAALGAAPAAEVSSPTFSLVHEYGDDPKVYHLDLYRLDTVPELETLGFEDLWDEQAVVLIEWGEKFDVELPGNRFVILLEHAGDDSRVIRMRQMPTLDASRMAGGS